MIFPFSRSKADELLFVPRIRAERLIAASRVVLAAFSLLAIRLDPSEPSKHAALAYALLAGYVLYAVVIALAVWSWETVLGRLGVATHALDLMVFSAVMYLTEGPTSPFFVYFIFSLVAATLRWQWRGTVYTAAIALAAFLGMGIYAGEVLQDPTFELNRFIIRSVYLAVCAVLLSYLGSYETRLRGELRRLSGWPVQAAGSQEGVLQALIESAASVVAVRSAYLLWEDEDEPWVYLAWLEDGRLRLEQHEPGSFHNVVASDLGDADFLCANVLASEPLVLCAESGRLRYWNGCPLDAGLLRKLNAHSVLCARVEGGDFSGRLFLLDKRAMTSDDLALAGVVAQRVAAGLEYFRLLEKLREAAVADERVRLAGDLHDGVLQSLTAAALQLQAARQLLEKDRHAADERLKEIQDTIASEQRELRFFVDELRPAPLHALSPATLEARVEDIGQRLQRQWGLKVETEFDASIARLPESSIPIIYRVVQEALMNAAKHAAATVVQVGMQADAEHAVITVSDNGRGFPFRGSFTNEQLIERKLGPVMLKERVRAAGGTIAIESGDPGACLTIQLPLPAARRAYRAHAH